MKTKTITLAEPLVWNNRTWEQIDLREPTWGEHRKAKTQPSHEQYLSQLVSFISGIPVPALDELPLGVMEEVSEAIEGFLNRGPQTGES